MRHPCVAHLYAIALRSGVLVLYNFIEILLKRRFYHRVAQRLFHRVKRGFSVQRCGFVFAQYIIKTYKSATQQKLHSYSFSLAQKKSSLHFSAAHYICSSKFFK